MATRADSWISLHTTVIYDSVPGGQVRPASQPSEQATMKLEVYALISQLVTSDHPSALAFHSEVSFLRVNFAKLLFLHKT